MQKNINQQNGKEIAVVIMAAGKGTRMKDPTRAKVMYEVLGKPMLHYVIELAEELSASRTIVVIGYQRETVSRYLNQYHPGIEIAIQAEQLGTGHAVMQSEDCLAGFSGDVIILSGDVPLLKADTMSRLIDNHFQSSSTATILTAEFDDPSGYGRIIRNEDGSVKSIVEHKDASETERNIKEINSGIYIFQKDKLFKSLKNISSNNSQKEYYLTDVFAQFWKNNWKVSALKTDLIEEIMGVNTVDQLNEVQQVLTMRLKI